MQRRKFLSSSVAGLAIPSVAGLALLGCNKAAEQAAPATVMAADNLAGGVYYTKENPGRWAAKVGGHLPVIALEKTANGTLVKVTTGHEMKGYEHYIVKHTLLDANMNVLGETMFDPSKDTPFSSYTVIGYSGTIYALSMCNQHDVWVASAQL